METPAAHCLYQPGQVLEGTNLSVLRQIGSGGMGSVYEVEELSLGRVYVLKVIRPELARGTGLTRRMEREAKVLARLEHENIVQVFWAGETGDRPPLPYYVMERLNGHTLRRVFETAKVRRTPLPLGFALDVTVELLRALAYAHERRVIHRDVKPENVFLHRKPSGQAIAKLLDFGILALLTEDVEPTSAGFKGTLRYAAPEQIRGGAPSPAMDLYAAALVLYEMLAGRGPFDDHGGGVAVAAAHLRDEPPVISRFREVPAELEQLISQGLRKQPEQRPADASAFADALTIIRDQLEPNGGTALEIADVLAEADEVTLDGSLGSIASSGKRLGTGDPATSSPESLVENVTRTVLPIEPGLKRLGIYLAAGLVLVAVIFTFRRVSVDASEAVSVAEPNRRPGTAAPANRAPAPPSMARPFQSTSQPIETVQQSASARPAAPRSRLAAPTAKRPALEAPSAFPSAIAAPSSTPSNPPRYDPYANP